MHGQGPPLKRSPVGLTGGDRGTRTAARQGKKFMSKNSLKTEFEGSAERKGSQIKNFLRKNGLKPDFEESTEGWGS